MATNSVSKLLPFLMMSLLVMGTQLNLVQCVVSYDKKSLIINGQRRILISGSIHYPRSTPEMWEDLVVKSKNGGLDVIDTYVFWNVHEPSPGKYDFSGRYDLVRFIKTVAKFGLYVNLRIGPYVCAEWNFGGFPVWLKYVPGISFRTNNEPFKAAMQGFTQKIVEMMKAENLFESQGGPIILSQIENEYGAQGKSLGPSGEAYVNWAAKMAVGLDTGVPWLMCKEDDAPDPVINTCNGFYCDSFSPNKPYKPTMWTEAWSGWFTEFGGPKEQRSVHDIAFAVARFVQKGGSFFNYYMYHGGTNFGRTAGGPFVTTSYDYDAPIDEYGLIRQPKYGHLRELHKAIKLCEPALLSSDANLTSLGKMQSAYVYSNWHGSCAAFLSNFNTNSVVGVVFNNRHYSLPPWSISILPDCKHVVYNTAKVGTQTSRMQMVPASTKLQSWETYHEDISSLVDKPTLTSFGLLEQINITRDTSDYLWYSTSIDINPSETFLHGGQKPTLTIQSRGHGVHVFINGQLSGSAFGTRENTRFTFSGLVNLQGGTNKISLLSIAAGLPNVGTHFETWKTGILGPVSLDGLDHGKRYLSRETWTYKVGMNGETMNLKSPSGISSVDWIQVSLANQNQQPLNWYKAYFDAPGGDEPLALDMRSMGRGQVWINGQSIGRYWTENAKGTCGFCKYSGAFRPGKCQVGCGTLSQRWYHVPRSWLEPTQNLLVLFEELHGDVSRISLVKRTQTRACAAASEHHPTIDNWQTKNSGETTMLHDTKLRLHCGTGQTISAIKFASFGTPSGTCGSFRMGTCHASNSRSILEKVILSYNLRSSNLSRESWYLGSLPEKCSLPLSSLMLLSFLFSIQQMCVGQQSCEVSASNSYFATDPCPNVLKRLSVEAVCSAQPNIGR